ncbi:MAG: hypothetical protein JXK07_13395 [Spirochaetes bacterium]|nr:hypothetical protein [Spirochaetota bacterium]
MNRLLIVIVSLSWSITAQNLSSFPLWGSSWIVAQGNNKKIFPSALPLKPCKLAIIEFKSNRSIALAYANLNHRTYRCTAELVEDIKLQMKKNTVEVPFESILTGGIVNISYRLFDDTLWTGDPNILDYFTKYKYIGRLTVKTDSSFSTNNINKLKNNPVFFRSKPVYYGIRSSTFTEDIKYSIESVDDDGHTIFLENENYFAVNSSTKKDMNGMGTVNLQALKKETPFVNYKKGSAIYEYIPCEYDFKTSNVGYWQVHVHPEVWYYPRDPFDGHGLVFDELKMTDVTAQEKRTASLNAPDNLDLKYYRNPLLSDSASVIISFAFCNIPNTNMTRIESISLVDTTVQINHFPPRMYRVPDASLPTNWVNYSSALYQLYSKDAVDEKRNRNLDSRCPAWQVIDRKNANLIFPEALQEPGRLVRDRNIDDGLFNYNDCPCSRIPSLKNLTPVQLQRLVFLTPPLCDRSDMIKALKLYDQIAPYLKKKADQDLIVQKKATVLKVLQERDTRAAKAGVSWSQPNERCPGTWVDSF